MSSTKVEHANPGPSWGYQIVILCEQYLPSPIFSFLLNCGVLIALIVMKPQRRASAEYWMALKGRKPTISEQFRHFRSFMNGLVLKLRTERGLIPGFTYSRDSHREAFEELVTSPQQVFFGTFHVGYSDVMGCMLKNFSRSISMVRLRVENSRDTEAMAAAFSNHIKFLWINDPYEFIFSLKNALQNGESIGLQCDRSEFGSKMEEYDFLGKKRQFPVTIYHLACMFNCPVIFSFTGPLDASGSVEVYTSKVFTPGPNRRKSLQQASIHFQEILHSLQEHLQKYPDLWFNFLPLPKAKGMSSD